MTEVVSNRERVGAAPSRCRRSALRIGGQAFRTSTSEGEVEEHIREDHVGVRALILAPSALRMNHLLRQRSSPRASTATPHPAGVTARASRRCGHRRRRRSSSRDPSFASMKRFDLALNDDLAGNDVVAILAHHRSPVRLLPGPAWSSASAWVRTAPRCCRWFDDVDFCTVGSRAPAANSPTSPCTTEGRGPGQVGTLSMAHWDVHAHHQKGRHRPQRTSGRRREPDRNVTVHELKVRMGTRRIVAISRTPRQDRRQGQLARRRFRQAGALFAGQPAGCSMSAVDLFRRATKAPPRGRRRPAPRSTRPSRPAFGTSRTCRRPAPGSPSHHLLESFFVPEQEDAHALELAKQWSILRTFCRRVLHRPDVSREAYSPSSSSTPVNSIRARRRGRRRRRSSSRDSEGHRRDLPGCGRWPRTLDGPARAAVVLRVAGKPFAFAQVQLLEQLLDGLKAARGSRPSSSTRRATSRTLWAKGGFDITTGDVASRRKSAPPCRRRQKFLRAWAPKSTRARRLLKNSVRAD